MIKKALYLTLSLTLTACISSPSIEDEHRPDHWGYRIDDQSNFYKISDTVYRSEQPSKELIPLIHKYNIDAVINLRARNDDKVVLKDEKLNLIHIPINTWSIDREDLLKVMKEIQLAKQANKNILIHCYHGSDRTGASIAMYRIIFEQWSTQDALNEMKYGGYGFHPIWINIEKLFNPENIKWIQQQLLNPS